MFAISSAQLASSLAAGTPKVRIVNGFWAIARSALFVAVKVVAMTNPLVVGRVLIAGTVVVGGALLYAKRKAQSQNAERMAAIRGTKARDVGHGNYKVMSLCHIKLHGTGEESIGTASGFGFANT